MSIDSQVKEMLDLAKKEDLKVVEVKKESHSAKISGKRPVFLQLVEDIRNEKFNGILSWAPDRLSRNDGDLGILVDLIDQEKLVQVRTFSQTFSNNPNEKFLLMILCSQAKLENDQRGVNVKRGIRAKCEMGWRPGPAPLGYINRSLSGVKTIDVDKESAHFIAEMFNRYKNGSSGRKLKKWADKTSFRNKSGKPVTLSQIHRILKDTFYYGEFEYPVESGNWYKGLHQPLIDKELFDEVQEKLSVVPKAKWGTRNVIFRGVFRCATCKSTVTGHVKFRKRKGKSPRRHVYYRCNRTRNSNCKERPIKEDRLVGAINRYISFMYMAHPQSLKLTRKLLQGMETFRKIQEEALIMQNINSKANSPKFPDYTKYILRDGTNEEKREILKVFDKQLYIHNKDICSSPL